MSMAFTEAVPWEPLWRNRHGVLPDDFIRWVAGLIDESGIETRLREWHTEERRGPGGRPERFPLRALLVCWAVTTLIAEAPHLTRVCNIMFRRLSPAMREELGIPNPPHPDDIRAWRAAYRCVRYRAHAGFLDLIDPSWLPKNRRMDDATFSALAAGRRAELSEAEWAQRRERLTWVCNQVLEVTRQLIPEDVRAHMDGSVGVDATVIPSPARAERRAGRSRDGKRAPIVVHSADPDAGLYSRPNDDRDTNGAVTGGRIVYGMEATFVVSGNHPDSPVATPNIVLSMAPLHRPGEQPGRNAIRALKDLRDRGHPARLLAADRAYTSAKPEDFQLPARALGYEPVLDYKVDQLGVKASHEGFIQVEGAWYCPAMPGDLIDATKALREGRITTDLYRQRIVERRKYAARPKGKPDAEGHVRLMCPAASNWPLARCDNKPASIANSTRGRIRIPLRDTLATNPPPCCTQQSITLPPAAGAKFAQPLAYGSDEWHAVYSTLRNTNEGMHGYLKDGAFEALHDPRRRRLLGVAAQSVQAALTVMAGNVRKIDSFLKEQARIEQAAIPNAHKRPPRRRTRSLATWLPENTESVACDRSPPETA